ncbi:pentatricopeptide repeat-containing protein [Tanacetum coccineum]
MDGVGGRHGVGSFALRFNITTKTHHLIYIITGGYSQNVFIGSKLIGLYFELGQFYMQDARKVFDNMSQRDVFIRNMMIQAYANSGFGNEALGVFKEMRGEGVDVDKFTYTFVLKACGVGSDVMMGRAVNGVIWLGIVGGLFDEIREKDVVSWNIVISGFVNNGCVTEAIELFHGLLRDEYFSILDIRSGFRRKHHGMDYNDEGLGNGMDFDQDF